MPNRQVAEQLVLSERTVEGHVRSIVAKLGYSTRTEIATRWLRHPMAVPPITEHRQ
jgi:DNA-binding NarL/FixJ family response regulator